MYRLGIDLGGTNIVAGLVDEEYKIVAKASCKTNVPRPESSICDSMAEVALKACEKADLPLALVEVDRQMVHFEQVRTNLETFRDMLTM